MLFSLNGKPFHHKKHRTHKSIESRFVTFAPFVVSILIYERINNLL